jgi:hypothetical protein
MHYQTSTRIIFSLVITFGNPLSIQTMVCNNEEKQNCGLISKNKIISTFIVIKHKIQHSNKNKIEMANQKRKTHREQ